MLALWCNGNTEDFGSLVQGSNPCGATNFKISNMIIFLIWIIPIILILAMKWQNLKEGTVKDMLTTHLYPACKKCGACEGGFVSLDCLVLVPFIGLLVIIWIYLHKHIQKLLDLKVK